ncbi:pentatricopeptide repeat-containing protein At2g13600-like [Selaginella moellendorffii]|uniref:pentatricopeptide repeat-containing protein At2g13600-like n=1 Tax=Selaginella moellendorffii TaxID=88036 RepID=UPI000D1CBDF3|nr:pentatricopeptide repeat-containing protein At2g13600-like [Selaginella moellendorffii]|eukprot:XP_024517651.1 pentatricopeptide repeat-containing protein At2g13600-like [Selaginella moellendorffii]
MLARRRSFEVKRLKNLSTSAAFVSNEAVFKQRKCDTFGARGDDRQVVAALKACSGSRDLEKGKEIHRRLGSNFGVFISTALVDMYSKCGCMAEARQVFDSIHRRDVVSWNAIITGYAHGGAAGSALELYLLMQQDGFVPNGRTFVATLSACASLAAKEDRKQVVARGFSIHSQVAKTGYEEDVFVASTLVDMHTKFGLMDVARRVFDSIQSPTVVLWTAMIMGYAQNGESDIALELFAAMQEQGYRLDSRTFVAALIACTGLASREDGKQVDGKLVKAEALRKGRSIHSLLQMSDNSQKLNAFVRNSLVDMLAKCGSMLEARAVFEQTSHHDVVLWNSIIHGYAQSGDGEQALEMFSRMLDRGVDPDARTFVAAIGACSSLASAEEAEKVNGKLVKVVSLGKGRAIHLQLKNLGRKVATDIYVENSLVDMYAKCGSLAEAREVFEEMQQRNVVSWTTMILGCVQNGESDAALELFTAMQEEGLTPQARTYVAALNACSSLAAQEGRELGGDARVLKLKSLERGRLIHLELRNKGHEPDVFVANSLVDMYANCGSIAEARSVFDRSVMLGSSSLAMWTSMILGYAELGENSTALELFESMIQQQLHPESRTFVAVIKACGNLADFERGRRVHEQIRSRRGYMDQQSELVVANSLITLYGKCGCMEEARAVFDAIPVKRRDLVAWSAIISGYSQQGDACQVFDLFERMQHEKIRPDGVTFLSVLSACNHTGLVDQARKYFHALLEDYREYATIQHYSCMVDLLGRANHLEEALAVVKSMPMEPDSTIWTSILASSRKWENVEAGRAAFERIQEKDGAAFVLLANSYAGRSSNSPSR